MAAPTFDCRSFRASRKSRTKTSAAAIVAVETQLKDIVQNLYNLIVQSYDHHGSKTQDAMKREMYVACNMKVV